ncbi:MAG: hypothetical protein BJ554DRAFT_3296 [Olpidium bornovanus]|uniref:Reverse transcriptase Ty1/copia-type domain-containing protein n=1 Tax=Olpidium bornovanus TaxID=278681 RepID=A0A8H8DGB4_9FUNG|nr:MAG: hypothetical protein BJ554DRAFT_3296 [Olpidium bornovanus]
MRARQPEEALTSADARLLASNNGRPPRAQHFRLVPPPDRPTNEGGTVEQAQKLAFVTRGFTETTGIDFDETTGPLLSHQAFSLLLAIAAAGHWIVQSRDVVTTYSKARLHHIVSIEQPAGGSHQ